MLGISTYAYLWRASDRVPEPWTLPQMLADAASLGAEVFEICDHAPLQCMDVARLHELRSFADGLGLRLAVGTRGVRAAHLRRFLEIAEALGAGTVRSMVQPADTPADVAREQLSAAMPAYEAAGVELALETYEQLSTAALVELVETVDSPALGITLDPGNAVAALERPADVVAATAAYVKNLHVKDFAFTREPGWVGFTFSGARLGEGLLDYAAMVAAVAPEERGIDQIVEHWLPWQGDAETTVAVEHDWTVHSMDYLKSHLRRTYA